MGVLCLAELMGCGYNHTIKYVKETLNKLKLEVKSRDINSQVDRIYNDYVPIDTDQVVFAVTVVFMSFLLQYGSTEDKACTFNEMCTCSNSLYASEINYINCAGVPLLHPPNFQNANIHNLIITDSGLEVLEADSLSNVTANSITLDNNKIHFIHGKAFFKMNQTLESLSLKSNKLEEIPINALQYLEKLKSLYLDMNQISSVLVNWSNMKNTLAELSLSGNDIENLPLNPEMSLMNMRTLSSINLAENALITLESNSLPLSLKKLNASGNNIKEFPQLLLNTLQDLSYLSLSNNFIESILSHKYDGKISLDELDLSHNLFEKVGQWFGKSVKIRKFNLNSNGINTIEKESFSDLECKKVDLSFNRLVKLDDGVFNGIESSLEYLDLSHNKLTKVPDAIKTIKNLETLKVAYNNLLKFKIQLSNTDDFKKLSLAGNLINIFPYQALASMKSLRTLDLSYNRLAEIRRSDFKFAKSLEKLNLQSNNILFLENNTFEHADRLSELSLSYNSIGSIDHDAFRFLDRSLEKLEISFGLKGFGFPNAFFTLKTLKFLALDNNNINVIPETISGLENLETLILDFNNIKELKSEVFNSRTHRNLKEIRLSFNKVPKIESKTFAGLQSLKTVGLHNNKIIKVSEYSFSNLSQDLAVYLSNNNIEIIESKSFSNLPRLKKVDLHGNNFFIFDYTVFENVTTESEPMTLNLSRNRIENIKVPSYQRNPVYINVLDLSHNKISKIPEKLLEIQTSLKSLNLSYNELVAIESEDFYSMVMLESLYLTHNKILNIKPDAFISLKKLQVLNLAHNHIEIIQNEQFKDLGNLRVLDLSFNNINTIPSSAFENTKIELLSLSNNKLSSVMSSMFLNIGKNLRSLDLSFNQISNVDVHIFSVLTQLHNLNFCHNKLTNHSLSAFQNSDSLFDLQLCSNEFTSINGDSFKNISNIRYLNLAETGLNVFPNLTLPTLKILNVSGNKIKNISESFFIGLPKLKKLNLSNNELSGLSSMKWIQLQGLKDLDLSSNPIKVLDQSCFYGLYSLRTLNLQHLSKLDFIDPAVFLDLVQLTALKMDVKSSTGIILSKIMQHLVKLKELLLHVVDDKLTNQLPDKFPKKLQLLEISGKNLRNIDTDSLKGLKDFSIFNLKITGTGIKRLQKHFLSKFKSRRFTIDLSNNELEHIGPESLYHTIGDTKRYGTRTYLGGLKVEKNPLVCGCDVKWLAQWLRRYLTETVNVNSLAVEERLKLIEKMNEVVCYHSKTKQMFPVLSYDVTYDEVLCVYVLNVPKVTTKGSGATIGTNMLLFTALVFFPFLCHFF